MEEKKKNGRRSSSCHPWKEFESCTTSSWKSSRSRPGVKRSPNMKSIDDTLKPIRDITSALPDKINIAITGGVAVILHGVERTTIDVDFCVYSDSISTRTPPSSSAF